MRQKQVVGKGYQRVNSGAMPKSNFLRKKSKTGVTTDFKRIKAKVGVKAIAKDNPISCLRNAGCLLSADQHPKPA